MSTVDTEEFRRRLAEERRRVFDALENLQHENPGSLHDETEELSFQDNHLGDVATATFDREMADSLHESESRLLSEIDAALERLDAGTFGICARGGRPSGRSRLEARPWATLCIDCQREMERS
jgi:RNA polymerase-binding protein DksA